MGVQETPTPVSIDTRASRKPMADELDIFGLTHPGKERPTNADHFVVASFRRAIQVYASSIPLEGFPPYASETRGVLFLVADGVGGLRHAQDGSAQATEAIARHLLEMGEVSLQSDPSREAEVLERLRTAAAEAHKTLVEFGEREKGSAATTLTMLIAIWPRAFVIHAGDSRCYRFRDGVMQQMTTDQTMAQVMIDSGAMSPEAARNSKLNHVLISALGSSQLDLQATGYEIMRGDRVLLCSDGLTRHVSDAEISEKLGSEIGSRAVCETLLQMALDRGGKDNITILTGRART